MTMEGAMDGARHDGRRETTMDGARRRWTARGDGRPPTKAVCFVVHPRPVRVARPVGVKMVLV